MLRLTAYKKFYGHSLILDVPQLDLEQNIYWLRGENGSGKTTFLKSVAGLLPFSGDVFVNDTSLRKQRRAYTLCVNHAAAEPSYPSFLTGTDLLDFYLQAKNGNKAAATKIAAAFGMTSYLSNKVDSYSSGMTKKLSLLLAFTGHPALILLDEPFTTLDVEAVKTLHHLIKELFAKGTGFCISSHQSISLPHRTIAVQNKTLRIE